MASNPTARPLRERLRRWTRPPRELSFTTAGKFFCLLTLGVGFGAINTGNNLLFLLLGMMLSLILASGILSEAVLRDLTARRLLPGRLVANHVGRGGYLVVSDKRWASLSIEVADRTATPLSGPRRGEVVGLQANPWWKVWKGKPTGTPAGSSFAMHIRGHETRDLKARFLFPARGRYRLEEVSLVTRFPFALFEKTRKIRESADVVVFPDPADASDWVASVYSRFGEVETARRGRGEEYFGLREYRPGEDSRFIHWKASAKRGELIVRETEERVQRSAEVCLCNFGSAPPPAFEQDVRKTAGLLEALLARGYRVGLSTAEEVVEPGVGARHLDRMLRALALCGWHRDAVPEWAATAPSRSARIAIGGVRAGVASDLAIGFSGGKLLGGDAETPNSLGGDAESPMDGGDHA